MRHNRALRLEHEERVARQINDRLEVRMSFGDDDVRLIECGAEFRRRLGQVYAQQARPGGITRPNFARPATSASSSKASFRIDAGFTASVS